MSYFGYDTAEKALKIAKDIQGDIRKIAEATEDPPEPSGREITPEEIGAVAESIAKALAEGNFQKLKIYGGVGDHPSGGKVFQIIVEKVKGGDEP